MDDLRVDTLKRWIDWAMAEARHPDEAMQRLRENVTPMGQVAVWETARAIARRDQVTPELAYSLLYRRPELFEFSLRYFQMIADLHGRAPVEPAP
jgi:hypothetical protein